MEPTTAAAAAAGVAMAAAAVAGDDLNENHPPMVDTDEEQEDLRTGQVGHDASGRASFASVTEDGATLPEDVGQLQEMVHQLRNKLAIVAPKSRKSGGKYVPKTPLGMRDIEPEEMALREEVFEKVKAIYKRHGAVSLQTPHLELLSTLKTNDNYGEDAKLIYELADQGGEKLVLRYDLTVPLARYASQNGLENLKRWQFGRVYRRDNPSPGRFREFYQLDFDIIGDGMPMVQDAEVIKVVEDVLSELDVGRFLIRVNDRRLLDGIFEVCGVPEDLLRPICSSVDKLDKLTWSEVKDEMLKKGINDETAEKIYKFVQLKGREDLIEVLLKDETLCANERAKVAVDELKQLFEFLKCLHVRPESVQLDLSLARGLTYYTSTIFEGILLDERLGSICGGGRYDNLISNFIAAKRGKNKKVKQVPCVGASIGIERLFTVIQKRKQSSARPTQVQVIGVAQSEDTDMVMKERLKLCAELWAAGINAETSYKANNKFMTQIQHCEKLNIPLAVVIGKAELEEGKVKIRKIAEQEEELAARRDMVPKLKEILFC